MSHILLRRWERPTSQSVRKPLTLKPKAYSVPLLEAPSPLSSFAIRISNFVILPPPPVSDIRRRR
ncbi:hypothetical protein T484DRAFT_3075413 [Baffinella frigidus]|nr:hypothetical protein T484DRAFT_3075413 [Cryptophyta sp. CCMP2293]